MALVLGACSFGFFSLTAGAQTYFFNRADFATGNYPIGVVLADFNGDGRLDMATINYQDRTVSILLGKPDGTFAPKTDIPAAFGGQAIAAGDFNGDGKMDMVVVNYPGSISIFLGKGDGTFQGHVEYASQPLGLRLAVGDFNHDGKPDVAVTYGGGVSVLLGNGDGTFQSHTDYITPGSPNSTVAADLNGDGNLDLAVVIGASNSSVYLYSILFGNGDGTFQAPVNHYTTNGYNVLVTADFNGDGILDLVMAGGTPDLFLGNGDGTFQAPQHIPVGTLYSPDQLLAADLNHDGKMDIIVGNVAANGASVFLGNGDGTFRSEVDYLTNQGNGAMAIGDVNGDANPDLVLTSWISLTATVLLGNGDGTFSPRAMLPPPPPTQKKLSPKPHNWVGV